MNKELSLKIINPILFALCGTSSLILLTDFLLFGFVSLTISESIFSNESVLSVTVINAIILVISLIGIIITNLLVIKYLQKNNESYVGKYKKIDKTMYILLTFFLGIFGINKFIIGNIKSGIIRLLFWVLVAVTIDINIIPLIIIYSLLGLIFSDLIIATTRKKDENNMIYAD